MSTANENARVIEEMSAATHRSGYSLAITIGWRSDDAALELATAVGEIAADLWIAGKLRLIEDPIVATLESSDAANDASQDPDREATSVGFRCEPLAGSRSR